MKKLILIIAISALAISGVSAQYSAVRVNVLGIATGTLNVGVDVAVSPRWSVEGSAYWNPIETNAFRSQAAMFSAGVRYWRFEPHVGPFIGIHNTTVFYDVGGKKHHYKGWMTGVGVSYGHTWLLSKRWNMTAEFGLGAFYMQDKRSNNHQNDNEDIYIHHYKRFVIAPSRAEVSISYLF